MIQNAHSLEVTEVLNRLESDPESGLTQEQVALRLKEKGENILSRKRPKSAWKILIEQFLSPIVYILIGAMFLAFTFSEAIEGFAILVVILLNSCIGFLMEYKALRSFIALEKLVQTTSLVVRHGKKLDIPSRLLVYGDIIEVRAGDVVPADARIIKQQGLQVKESVLTGESRDVNKTIETVSLKSRITEQRNMIFGGTTVTRGNALAVIILVGDDTAIGQISRIIQDKSKKRSPLQKKLNKLTNWLIVLTLILAGIIVLTGLLSSNDAGLMLKTGIALAVAAIPEGLPVVATITLARGMLKLSRKQVVIKELESVQTLGETNIICTDKTGTLTENKMQVRVIELEGEVLDFDQFKGENEAEKSNPAFKELIEISVLCNNSNPVKSKHEGDAIEDALIEFTAFTNFDAAQIASEFPEFREYPFDTEKKMMATVNQVGNSFKVNIKGAPENIIDLCATVNDHGKLKPFENKIDWLRKVEERASEGLKILAFANRCLDTFKEGSEIYKDFVFVGIVGFLDPPRKDIANTMKVYKDAGISVKMITGDHPGTAVNVAKSIGLLEPNHTGEELVKGTEFSNFKDCSPDLQRKIIEAKIYSRMLPKQKLEIVEILQMNGGVVGMLGDGVNDVPALKVADIGIAMGVRGTEAAKDVADVILLDDKFTAIKLAIHQGRAIFENIRYFVIFLISCNLAEVISVTVSSLINLPMPLLPMQILYLNLVTDIFPALALGMGKGSRDIMKMGPRPSGEGLLIKKHWRAVITYGLAITLSVIAVVICANFYMELSLVQTNNMAFVTLVLAQLLNVLNLPELKTSFWNNEITRNKWIWLSLIISLFLTFLGFSVDFLSDILSLERLSFNQVMISLGFASISLVISQLLKRVGVI